MLLEKLAEGVLRVQTPLGPRFVKPPFAARVYLLWLFRNFPALPANVLSRRQRKRIEAMCHKHGFISQFGASHGEELAVLGTLEQRVVAEETASESDVRSSIGSAVSSLTADAQQES